MAGSETIDQVLRRERRRRLRGWLIGGGLVAAILAGGLLANLPGERARRSV